jgi:hypothetical protein
MMLWVAVLAVGLLRTEGASVVRRLGQQTVTPRRVRGDRRKLPA